MAGLVERGSVSPQHMHRIVLCLTTMELIALKPWSVKSVKESDCEVTDHSTSLQRFSDFVWQNGERHRDRRWR